jgi:hypothetical protein
MHLLLIARKQKTKMFNVHQMRMFFSGDVRNCNLARVSLKATR